MAWNFRKTSIILKICNDERHLLAFNSMNRLFQNSKVRFLTLWVRPNSEKIDLWVLLSTQPHKPNCHYRLFLPKFSRNSASIFTKLRVFFPKLTKNVEKLGIFGQKWLILAPFLETFLETQLQKCRNSKIQDFYKSQVC